MHRFESPVRVVHQGAGTATTEMIGEVSDHAALVGLINMLYNLGHAIISVERLSPDQINEITKE